MPQNKGNSFVGYLIIAIFGLFAGIQIADTPMAANLNFFADPIEEEKSDQADQHAADLSLYWQIWDQIDQDYVDTEVASSQERVYGSIKGLVSSLDDPYTVFMDPEESKQFSDSLEGKLEGIGAELNMKDGNLTVVSPLRDSPAERAGILPGDIIYKIEGEYAIDLTLFEAIMQIRGEMGTPVTLSIIREGVDKPFDVTIIRDSIQIDSVTVEELENDLVYLSINNFNDTTNEEFGAAISKMILEVPKGLIIDLRFNSGGYLDSAVELLSYLLPKGAPAVIIRERDKADDVLTTNGNPKLLSVPIVVLVNEGSASASEIMAGAIQDHKRGILMGTQTYGKGSVQEVENYTDGSSIRMTIAHWYTPNNQDINEVGLTPDRIVEITDEDIENEYDRQKEAAIEYLNNL